MRFMISDERAPRLRRPRRRRHGADVLRARAASVARARARRPSASPRRTGCTSRSSRRWKSARRATRTSSCTGTPSTRSTSRKSRCPRSAPSALSREEIEERIKSALDRKIVVVGACTGSDAHTVGIDAILNYKGYAGDKGLESYKGFEAYNLGAQVENEQLAARALALKRRRDPGQPGHHAAQLPQGERARARSIWRKNRAFATRRHPPPRRPAHRSQARARARVRRGVRPGTKPGDVASFLVERLCSDDS